MVTTSVKSNFPKLIMQTKPKAKQLLKNLLLYGVSKAELVRLIDEAKSEIK